MKKIKKDFLFILVSGSIIFEEVQDNHLDFSLNYMYRNSQLSNLKNINLLGSF